MNKDVTQQAYMFATGGGLILWIATALLSARAEPWDSGLYWFVSYPLALTGAALLGYAYPQRPTRWALALIFSQLLVMIFSGSGLGLLPLGIILLGILSLPALALAKFGAYLRGRRSI